MDIRSIVRIGIVSTINPANCSVRVAFSTQDDLVTYELPVITRGSQNNKDYWMPDVNEQVLCIFLPNISGRGVCDGFVLGSFYSTEDAPEESSADVHAIKYSDGTVIKHDRSSGDLTINATGNINITAGGTVTINGSIINLN